MNTARGLALSVAALLPGCDKPDPAPAKAPVAAVAPVVSLP